jgi:hypothetical protein
VAWWTLKLLASPGAFAGVEPSSPFGLLPVGELRISAEPYTASLCNGATGIRPANNTLTFILRERA